MYYVCKGGEHMIYDFIQIDKLSKTPAYRQIYLSIKTAVENSNLKIGSKLPSIRKLAEALKVSKTTVEAAYNQLCAEGYITNLPQKGYFVNADILITKKLLDNYTYNEELPTVFEYDFGSKGVELSSTNIKLWKKYIHDTLNKEYLINTYGQPQGELLLRQALQRYCFSVRGVTANPENIIIGAGTQPLLYIICGLLGSQKTAAIEKNTYLQAEQVFSDCNYNINYFDIDNEGAKLSSLSQINPDVMLINPNFNTKSGENMPIQRRINLINSANKHNCLIIEDDYNGELRYNTHPIPSIQSYDTQNVVYFGSFSKTLLPSVRMSYMVLPQKLMKRYKSICKNYNQTASKIEQLALAQYILDGKFENHLRKTRKHFAQKSKTIIGLIYNTFGQSTKLLLNETSLYIAVKVDSPLTNTEIFQKCKAEKINIIESTSNDYSFILSFSGIESHKIENGIKQIKNIIF